MPAADLGVVVGSPPHYNRASPHFRKGAVAGSVRILCACHTFDGGALMYRLLTSISAGELFKRQLPVFFLAFLIAELFYKFHSFTLECAAFLATWFVLDGVLHLLTKPRSPQRFPD
jgi:hypothetical protein